MPTTEPEPQGPGWIVASGLSKRFGRVRAVDALSFSVPPGSITGFLGPNGAGKTTTLRMLLGLLAPDSGSATINGFRYAALPVPTREVGTVLELQGFHPARSGRDHLRVYCTACGYPLTRADQALELVGLGRAGRRAAGGYSLGMRQRLALATALLGDPRVLVLDEPASGLDPEGVAWIRQMLREFSRGGGTVLFSSHVLSEVEVLADRVVIVARGRLVGQGTMGDLSGHEEVVVLMTDQADRMLAELAETGASVVRAGPDHLRVTGMPPIEIGRIARLHNIDLHELSTHRAGLEDIFLKLTSDSAADVVGSVEGSARVQMNSAMPRPASFAAPSPSLGRLIAAERRKLFSTRAWLWMLLASTAWTILYSALAIGFNGVGEPSLSSAVGQRALLAIGAGGAGPLAAILGAVGVTSEFRHRTATTTFLVIPRRSCVAAAKVAMYFIAGVAYALPCLAVSFAIAIPWLAARHIGIVPSGLGDIGVIAAVVVSVALFAVAGVGLGLLCRAQLATVMALLIYLYVVEPLISHIAVIHGFSQYLPGVAADGLTQATQSGVVLLSPWLGGLVFAGYGAALIPVGTWLTTRRDVP